MSENPTRIGFSAEFDKNLVQQIQQTISKSNLPIDEILELWPLFTRRVQFIKFMALIEIFKETVNIPGSIVECGVFK